MTFCSKSNKIELKPHSKNSWHSESYCQQQTKPKFRCATLRFSPYMLPAGLLFIVSLYALSMLSFCVIVCRVCPAVCWCIFIFLKRWKFFKNNFVCVGKASSFAIFGLCVSLCELQMCLLLGLANSIYSCL